MEGLRRNVGAGHLGGKVGTLAYWSRKHLRNKILSKNLHFLQDLTTNRDLIGEQINHLHNKKEQ